MTSVSFSANSSPHKTHLLDATGLKCPLPILRAHKMLKTLLPGEMLALVSSDEASQKEIPLFCEQAGYELLEASGIEDHFTFLIRK